MSKQITLREWLAKQAAGEFESADVSTQCDAGWYDWFCKDSSLVNRLRKMVPAVKRIANSHMVDQDRMYVFFKNNCPMVGPTYDDFRICDINTGDVIWTISPKCSHSGKAEVWSKFNDFNGPLITGTMRNIYAYFGV